MKFDLKTPCKDCPFVKGNTMKLHPERVNELDDGLRHTTFSCHKTVEYDDEDGEGYDTEDTQHCAGALILLEKEGRPGQMQQIAQRIGMYDPAKLNMEAPVYDSFDEMYKDMEDGY